MDKFSKDKNYIDYFSYIEQKKPGSTIAALNPLFLNSEVDVDKKLIYLKLSTSLIILKPSRFENYLRIFIFLGFVILFLIYEIK